MTVANSNSDGSFVLMQLGTRRFALPSNIVAELAPPVRLHAFPHTAPLLAGVIVRRGHLVPVYDVAPILLGRSASAHRFYLIALRDFGKVSEPSAIPVDGECELATADMQPPDAGRPAYVSGRLALGGESVDVLDFEALVISQSSAAGKTDRTEALS
jgi:chemotaxis signal transduction protein